VGLVAALELISELGVENIARELLRKRAWCAALQAKVTRWHKAMRRPRPAVHHLRQVVEPVRDRRSCRMRRPSRRSRWSGARHRSGTRSTAALAVRRPRLPGIGGADQTPSFHFNFYVIGNVLTVGIDKAVGRASKRYP